jgi:nucleotide-binding universal stress UspA family protein
MGLPGARGMNVLRSARGVLFRSMASASSLPEGVPAIGAIRLLKESSTMFNAPHDGVAIRNIAIATDFSPWSDSAMQHALLVARWYGAAVHILHTVRLSEFSLVPDILVPLDDLADRDCKDLIARLHASHSLDNLEYRCWNLHGEVASVFEDFVRDQNIDLMVLGTRGRSGISKLLLGSVAHEIFRCVSCPVLTVGPWSRGVSRQLRLKNVLFATDLSSPTVMAMPYVISAAKMWRAGIDVLHVCSTNSSGCEQRMEVYRNALQAMNGNQPQLSIRSHVVPGAPSSTVLDFACKNKADLIVLGLENHRSLYGGPPLSHSYEVVREAPCPVLSVRSAPLITFTNRTDGARASL